MCYTPYEIINNNETKKKIHGEDDKCEMFTGESNTDF